MLYKIEENINKALKWRTYDELNQLKEVLQKISNDSKNVDIKANDLINTYKDEELKIKKNIKSVFPKVERWSSMATILSIPLVVAGVSTGSPLITSIGAGTAGAATIVKKYLDVYKSKYRWVGHTIINSF